MTYRCLVLYLASVFFYCLQKVVGMVFRKFILPALVFLPIFCQAQARWQTIEVPADNNLVSVSFIDYLHGWIAADDGTLLHTSDGGKNWTVQHSFDGVNLCRILLHSSGKGWAIGRFPDISTALMYRTFDHGDTWSNPAEFNQYLFTDLCFVNDSTGWLVGYDVIDDTTHIILKTTNGGNTWDTQLESPLLMCTPQSVHFRDSLYGNICGRGPVFLHTGNGGANWAIEISDLEKDLYDMVNIDEVYGCAVGADGRIFFTRDSWSNFMEFNYENPVCLRAVASLPAFKLWAVGDSGTVLALTYISFMYNLSITPHNVSVRQRLNDVIAIDENHVWAVGDSGTVLFYGLEMTSDRPTVQAVPTLEVYPNPVTDWIEVYTPHSRPPQNIKLTDGEGRNIQCKVIVFAENYFRIDLQGLLPGIYILTVDRTRQKIVIIR